jgi:hypothetical protein
VHGCAAHKTDIQDNDTIIKNLLVTFSITQHSDIMLSVTFYLLLS